MQTQAATAEMIHPFELRGLGKAPFRYAGAIDQHISHGRAVIGHVGGCEVSTKPGGTCDHCGQFILNMYRVESSDGRRFTVGSECIKKVSASAAVVNMAAMKADLKALAKARTLAKKGKEADRIGAARRAFLIDTDLLGDKPHPNATLAARGNTLRDYAEWMFANAGHSGKFSVCRMIEKAIG